MILLTFDVEDWFQVENLRGCFPHSTWDACELRVEASTHRILDLLDQTGGGRAANGGGSAVRGTFFVLGWVAERVPGLVQEIAARGHEVASHGHRHRLCRLQEPAELARDLERSKKLLEDLTGKPVSGYRAPGFSISPAILEQIAATGYWYDSSFNSFALNPRYGSLHLDDGHRRGIAYRVTEHLHELPVSNLRIDGRSVPWAGGGYFRLLPPAIFLAGVRKILARDGGYLFYLHPWEFDPDQPRAHPTRRRHRFRHYLNLGKTAERFHGFLESFKERRFVTCSDYLRSIE